MIIFYLAWLNCNTFSARTFLGVASGGGNTNLHYLAFFSTHVRCIKVSVIQSVHNQCLLELGKNNLCLCSEPAGSCVNMGSVLPWENLHGCDVSLPDQTTSSQCRRKQTLCGICNSVLFISALYCHKGVLPFSESRFLLEQRCVHLVKK